MQTHTSGHPCGRPSTPSVREMEKRLSTFCGLPEGVSHFEVLSLLKRLKKQIGISSTQIAHLDYLISFTRPCDWQAGSRPIVYKTVAGMSHDLDISERQINKRERELHGLGLLTWTDSSNFRRSGYRDENGEIVSAFGVDLSPLAVIYSELVELAEAFDAARKAWDIAKRSLFAEKRRLRARLDYAAGLGAVGLGSEVSEMLERLSAIPRISGQTPLAEINRWTAIVSAWVDEVDLWLDEAEAAGSRETGENCAKSSDQSEQKVPTYTRYKQGAIFKENTSSADTERPAAGAADVASCVVPKGATDHYDGKEKGAKSGPKGQRPPEKGLEKLRLETILSAATEEFHQLYQAQACQYRDPLRALVEAACLRSGRIGIHRSAWRKACSVMSKERAATAVLIIDRNRSHPHTPIVSAGGTLRAMTDRDKRDELNLLASLFGILDRQGERLQ